MEDLFKEMEKANGKHDRYCFSRYKPSSSVSTELLTFHHYFQTPSPGPRYPQIPSPPRHAAARPATQTRAVPDIPSSRVGPRLRSGRARCISGNVAGYRPSPRSRKLSMLAEEEILVFRGVKVEGMVELPIYCAMPFECSPHSGKFLIRLPSIGGIFSTASGSSKNKTWV